MKQLKLLSMSILIGSALLLSAAKQGTAQDQSPRPTADSKTPLAQSREKKAAAIQAESVNPTPTPAYSQPTKPEVQATRSNHSAAINQQNGETKPGQESEPSFRTVLEIIFTFVTTVATISLAVFTYQLVHADRPFLIPEKQLLASRWPSLVEFENGDLDNLTAQLTLRNCGKGPAIIDEAVGRLDVVDRHFLPSANKFDDCLALIITPSHAFAAGESTDCVSPRLDAGPLKREELEDIWQNKKWLLFYGRITYRDVFGANYKLTFLYAYQYAAGFIHKGFFYPPHNAPVGFNKYT
jgi:hypothetical protein